MSKELIRLQDLTMEFDGERILDGINLYINDHEFLTLLGPSGCGKTTTLRMIAGFESPDEGGIYLGGEKIDELTPDKRDTAMVFQSYALLPHYNIFDNVAYGLKLRKMPKDVIKQKVTDILELVGLSGMEARMTNQLSGGQQQRVALARALVVEPGVLLFDEPLSNLDAKLRVSMRTEIRRIQQKAGITAVYVTHDQSEAMSISDKIIIMNAGKIAQMGTPHEIYYHPVNEFVADFIGEANFLKGKLVRHEENVDVIEVNGKEVKVESTGDRLAVGADTTIVLRPESTVLCDEGVLPCEVIVSTFMGAYQLYHVMVGDTKLIIHEYNPKGKKIYSVGDKAGIYFEPDNAHAL